MTEDNWTERYRAIADHILSEGDYFSGPAPAPNPAEMGAPDYFEGGDYLPGDDDAEMLPHDLDAEEMRKIDPAVIERYAIEPQNDTGNGQRLLHHYAGELLHVREIGWHRFVGTHWEPNGGEENAVDLAQRTAERIALEADYLTATPGELTIIAKTEEAAKDLRAIERKPFKDWSEAEKETAAKLTARVNAGKDAVAALQKRQINRRNFAVSSGNGSRILQMLNMAKPHRTVTPEALDADPLAFNVRNGTLRFIKRADPDAGRADAPEKFTVELSPHDPGDLIAKCAPVDYVPDATSPRFDAFMSRFQPAEAVRRFIQAYHGYAMTGLTGEQCLMFNIGGGSNGKSTFLEIVCRIMGPYAQTLQFASIAEIGFGRRGDQATPDIARLPGARLVRASEPKRGEKFDEAMLKSMTGGEPTLVRHLQKGFFEFRPVFKLALSGNHRPEIGGVDHGIWRRMRIVPWPVQIADNERRPLDEVLAEFAEESSGILNWLIAGALDYLNNGLKAPAEVTDATEDYREEMDPIGGIIRDCVNVMPPPVTGDPYRVTTRDMYQAFCAWCAVNSVRAWREKSFAQAMVQKGFVKDRSNRVRRYLNIRLHDVPVMPNRRDQGSVPGDDDMPPI
jgi:putative DNA primase/helicase